MRRLVCSLLALALLGVGAVAQAVVPGYYLARTYRQADHFDAVVGTIQLRRLEGDASLPKLEVFCISTSDGERVGDSYAGIINHHGPARATGTIMFKLTAQERRDLLAGKPVKGTWLKGINTEIDNVRFNTISDTRISCWSMEGEAFPIPYKLPNEYRYLDGQLGGETEIALKLVALAKIRGLKGESFNLRAQNYQLELTDYDTDILTVEEGGVAKKYSVANNLTNIIEINGEGGGKTLCSADLENSPFGNAICTGDDVLVRNDSSRAGEIVDVLNKGDVVKYYNFEEGETIGDSNRWAYVMLKNGKTGYVFNKYIQYIENR